MYELLLSNSASIDPAPPDTIIIKKSSQNNLTFPKVTLANRANYDTNATAWFAGNKPTFALS